MRENKILQILIVFAFASLLLPTFLALPKVPAAIVFFSLAIAVATVVDYRYLFQPLNLIVIAILLLHIFYVMFNWYNESDNKTLLRFVIPILTVNFLNRFYSQPTNNKRFQWIIKFICYAFLCTSISTIVSLNIFPDAARALAGSLSKEGNFELITFYLLIGIGGYTITIGWALLISLYIYLAFFMKKKLIPKFVLFISLPLFFFAIYKVSIATSVIIMLIALLYFLFFRNVKSLRQYLLRLSSFIIIILLITSTLSSILYFTADILNSENISPRLNNIAMRFDGTISNTNYQNLSDEDLEEEDKFLGGYAIRANRSLKSFSNNPLVGGGEVGGHHFYLDALGSWGLIGSLLIFLYMLSLYYKWHNIMDKSNFILYTHLFVTFVFLGFVKTYILLDFFILIYFIVPSMLLLGQQKKLLNKL